MTGGARFWQSYIGIGYLLGRRGEKLLAGLEPQPEVCRRLAEQLSSPEREHRARALAAALAPLAAEVENRRLR